ncbi:MAG TPA: aldehyde dehydrogenase family protein, partial [Longimicrobium sp.]|nr:aldehyde dehydrogenase family protein [Longimicrobium sp.]
MSIAEIFETLDYGPAPESASPALRWLEERGRATRLYVGGEWRDPEGGEYFDSDNPATGKPLARVAQGSAADVDAAVRAARAAPASRPARR